MTGRQHSNKVQVEKGCLQSGPFFGAPCESGDDKKSDSNPLSTFAGQHVIKLLLK